VGELPFCYYRGVRRIYENVILRQVALIGGFYLLYRESRVVIAGQNPTRPLLNAQRVLHLERILHFAWEIPVQQFFLRVPDVVKTMNLYYFICQFAITGLFFVWLFFRHRAGFYRLRNAVAFASLIALAVYWLFPTAPPRMAGIGLEDTMRVLSNINLNTLSHSGENAFAAVPSLHAAWALAVGLGIIVYSRSRFRWLLGILYPLSVSITIVATGNHFIFDVLAGMLTMVMGLVVVDLLGKARPAGLEEPERT